MYDVPMYDKNGDKCCGDREDSLEVKTVNEILFV